MAYLGRLPGHNDSVQHCTADAICSAGLGPKQSNKSGSFACCGYQPATVTPTQTHLLSIVQPSTLYDKAASAYTAGPTLTLLMQADCHQEWQQGHLGQLYLSCSGLTCVQQGRCTPSSPSVRTAEEPMLGPYACEVSLPDQVSAFLLKVSAAAASSCRSLSS